MTPEQLSQRVGEIVALAQERVGPNSIGAQQYYDAATGTQGFERMSPGQLLTYVQEECLDLINYGCMMWLKMNTVRELLGHTAIVITPTEDLLDEEGNLPDGFVHGEVSAKTFVRGYGHSLPDDPER